jgi:hypothetical protein
MTKVKKPKKIKQNKKSKILTNVHASYDRIGDENANLVSVLLAEV